MKPADLCAVWVVCVCVFVCCVCVCVCTVCVCVCVRVCAVSKAVCTGFIQTDSCASEGRWFHPICLSSTAFCSVCFPKFGGVLPRFHLSLQMTSSLQKLTTVTRHLNVVIALLCKKKRMYSPPYFAECSGLLNI